MKRFICIVFILVLLTSLLGCGKISPTSPETISFYYCRTEYQYNTEDAIIVSEDRPVSAHSEDLKYVLSLYLMGPLDDSLASPFHDGTRLFDITAESGSVSIILSSQDNHLSDSSFSLACACISLTCMDITEAESITVTSGRRSVTMTRDSMLLSDAVLQQEQDYKE